VSNFMNRMANPGAWDVSVIVVWLLVVVVVVLLGVLVYRLLAGGGRGTPGAHGTPGAGEGGDAGGSAERRYELGRGLRCCSGGTSCEGGVCGVPADAHAGEAAGTGPGRRADRAVAAPVRPPLPGRRLTRAARGRLGSGA